MKKNINNINIYNQKLFIISNINNGFLFHNKNVLEKIK